MPRDDDTFGFNREDADEIIESLGTRERAIPINRSMGGGAVALFKFVLAEPWANGAADAEIWTLDGADATFDGEFPPRAYVYDPLRMFTVLSEEDDGLCILQGGKYYAIQAKCPG